MLIVSSLVCYRVYVTNTASSVYASSTPPHEPQSPFVVVKAVPELYYYIIFLIFVSPNKASTNPYAKMSSNLAICYLSRPLCRILLLKAASVVYLIR